MKFKEMNTPNKLTTIRMFCVPFVLVLFILYMLNINDVWACDYYLLEGYNNATYYYLTLHQVLIAILFAFASITDFVDGHMARSRNIVSDFGKMMDPLADKLLVNTTLICMLASGMFIKNGIVTWYNIIVMGLVILTIARDIFVDALRMQSLKKGVVVPAMIWGKLKTATLMPGIVILLFGSSTTIIYAIGLIFIALGGIFAIISGVMYFKAMAKYIGE